MPAFKPARNRLNQEHRRIQSGRSHGFSGHSGHRRSGLVPCISSRRIRRNPRGTVLHRRRELSWLAAFVARSCVFQLRWPMDGPRFYRAAGGTDDARRNADAEVSRGTFRGQSSRGQEYFFCRKDPVRFRHLIRRKRSRKQRKYFFPL